MGAAGREEAAAVTAEHAAEPGAPEHLRPVEEDLEAHARAFDFFRAVLLMERLHPDRDRPGDYGSPRGEAVRFSVNPSLSFGPNQIHELEFPEEGPPRLTVNFMGLVGPQGVLPQWYTQLVAGREWEGDTALRDFLDLFHHRILSLFYRAWRKNQFLVGYGDREDDSLSRHLLDLLGAGSEPLRSGTGVDEHALVFHAGLLGPQQRSAQALEQLVSDYFDVPARVEQFVGGWYPISPDDQCTLGADALSSRLGVGSVAGDEIWDQQARVRVEIGPLSRRRYDEFLPGGRHHEPLREITRFFGRGQYDFEVRLILAADEVPGVVLDSGEGESQPLGWCTWIRTEPRGRDADETILTL